MKTKSLVLYADKAPMKGVKNPGSHQIYRNPRLRVEERNLGELGSDKIRVQMLYTGLCGTDVHLADPNPATGYIRCSSPTDIPPHGRVIGHEGVGRVIAAGSKVRHVREGAYVTFESLIVCRSCDMCQHGRFDRCRHVRLLGMEEDGLFTTVADVPAMLAHDVTSFTRNEAGLKAAACIEPAAAAYIACQNTHVTAGDVIVIFGGGPIGVFCAMLSKIVFGASLVHIVEPVEFRRQLAGKWCDRTYDPAEFFAGSKDPVDVVMETSGDLENVRKVFPRLNGHGRVALLARSGEPLVLDAVDHMITNAIAVSGSRGHPGGAFGRLIHLYANGQLPLDQLVTQVVSGPEGLRDALQSPGDILAKNCKILGHLAV